MAKSGNVISPKGGRSGAATAYFDFRWSSESAGVGKTKVNWELWRCGRHSSPKRYAHGYTINIKYKGTDGTSKTETLTKTYSFTDDDTHTFDDDKAAAKAKTGSFVVQHSDNGAGTFTVEFSDIRIYTDSNIGPTTHSISLETNYPYTACTAPTTVTVVENSGSGNRVKPGGVIKISWSGAKPGTSNAISGYQVQYKIGSGNWVEVSSKISGSSVTETIGTSATRGASIVAQVKTLGEQTGYDSGFKASGDSCKVNVLPNKPVVTVAKKLFASTSTENLDIVATAGSSNDSGQTAKIAYRIRSQAQANAGTNTTITIDTDGSHSIDTEPNSGAYLYEFWTYDGLEYSSSEAFYVIKNTSAPTVSNVTVSGTALVSQNNSSGKDYIVSPNITWTKGNDGYTNADNSNNSYRIGIQYSKTKDFSTGNTTNVLVQSNITTSLSYDIPDVRAYIPITLTEGYYYRIYIQRYDGIEWGTGYSNAYYVTKIPKTTHVLNDIYGIPNDANSEFHQYFSKKLNIYLEYDQGYNRINFTAKTASGQVRVGPLPISLSTVIIEGNKYLYCSLGETSLQDWTRGSEYSIFIAPKYVVGGKELFVYSNIQYTQGEGKSTRIRTYIPPAELTINWSGDIRPFTSGDQTITFLSIHSNKTNWYWAYGFNEAPKFTVYMEYNGKTKSASGNYEYKEQSADVGAILLPGSKIYDLFINSGFFNVKSLSKYKVTMGIKATNAFSEVYGGKVVDKAVDFNEDFSIDNQQLYIKDSTSGTTYPFFGTNGASRSLKEGMKICLKAEVTSYHGTPNGLRAQLYSDGTLVFNGAHGGDGFTKKISGAVVSHKNPITYSFDQEIGSIPQITKDMTLNSIKIICADARAKTITNTYSGNDVPDSLFRRHTVGKALINEGTYSEEKMTIKLSISDFGLNDPRSDYGESCKCNIVLYYVNENNTNKTVSLLTDGSSLPTILQYEREVDKIGSFSKVYVTIKIEYTAKGAVSTYITRTPEFVIYNSLPTVSYRKNQIGINCDPTGTDANKSQNIKDASLVVGAHSGKNKVVFKSANQELVIDLDKGEISSFTIDCGIWTS